MNARFSPEPQYFYGAFFFEKIRPIPLTFLSFEDILSPSFLLVLSYTHEDFHVDY